MTLSSTNNIIRHPKPYPDWFVTAYGYNFKIFDEGDLEVSTVNNTTQASTVLTLGTHYTVEGVGDDDGGLIDMTEAGMIALEDQLVIRRVLPITQDTDFQNQGAFLAKSHESTFDRITMILQQIDYIAARALRLADGPDASGFDFTLPPIVAGNAIIFNETGDGLDSVSTADFVGPTGPEGPQGPSGNTVLSGAGDPTPLAGEDGDFWINDQSWTISGPKAGIWPAPTSLIGPAGQDGFTEAAGDGKYEQILQPFYNAGATGAFLVLTWTTARQRQKITIDANTTLRIEGLADGAALELLITISGANRTLAWEADTGITYVHMSNGGSAPTPPTTDGKKMSLLIIRDGATEYIYQTGANE